MEQISVFPVRARDVPLGYNIYYRVLLEHGGRFVSVPSTYYGLAVDSARYYLFLAKKKPASKVKYSDVIGVGGYSRRGELKKIVVRSEYRGRGYGRTIISMLEQFVEPLGVVPFMVVNSENIAMLALADSLGYAVERVKLADARTLLYLRKGYSGPVRICRKEKCIALPYVLKPLKNPC